MKNYALFGIAIVALASFALVTKLYKLLVEARDES